MYICAPDYCYDCYLPLVLVYAGVCVSVVLVFLIQMAAACILSTSASPNLFQNLICALSM